MDVVPFVTSDVKLVERAESLAGSGPGFRRWDPSEALGRLHVDLPELFVVDLCDPAVAAAGLLDAIRSDPWLVDGGMVTLCREDAIDERWAEAKGTNFLALVPREHLDTLFPRVLSIALANKRLLLQRVIGRELVPHVGGAFEISNDTLEAYCHQALLVNYLFNANRIDSDTKEALSFSLQEMLLNAIEHGNCGIGYDEKNDWLESGRRMEELIEERRQDPTVDARRVRLEYDIDASRSRFQISDEGAGFDWRTARKMTPAEAMTREHGRGIAMTQAMADRLTWNEKGNEVHLEIEHETDTASATPGLLEEIEPRDVEPGETVFREGEPGDFLYFIARGRYDVLVGGEPVAVLTPEDLFMGEMAFLLRSPRSATVRARTKGRLIQVSKSRFVDAIRERPHYALLLSRLLAQRVERMGHRQAEAAAAVVADVVQP